MYSSFVKTILTLNDLPHPERPRERLAQHGASTLSSVELLALILGRGTRGEPVMIISQKLISRFGSLRKLADASIEDLKKTKGLGLAKASQLKACFEIALRLNLPETPAEKIIVHSPEDIFKLLQPKIGHFTKEHFILVSCNTRSGIIGMDTVSIGILNASLLHPREIFDTAIRRHAASIMLVHNHPSGDPDPSDADIEITKKIYQAGQILGIPVVDHIIIATRSFSSLREMKLLR